MPGRYEFKVIPAPTKGKRAKGAKGAPGRFANALSLLMNDMAEEGWEFQRAESLPSVERVGLTGSETHQHNLLVFRRLHPASAEPFQPTALPAPAAAPVSQQPEPQLTTKPAAEIAAPSPAPDAQQTDEDTPAETDEPDLPQILKERTDSLRA